MDSREPMSSGGDGQQAVEWAVPLYDCGMGDALGVRAADAERMLTAIAETGGRLLGLDVYTLDAGNAAHLDSWCEGDIGNLWLRGLDETARPIEGARRWIRRLPDDSRLVIVPVVASPIRNAWALRRDSSG
jgi:hypothetical protein